MEPRRTSDEALDRGEGTDGSVERLRADIDRGRTGDKVDWPDPAAAPLGTDDEAAGTPVRASMGGAVHRAETTGPSVPRQKRHGLGAAWVLIVVAFVFAAIVIGAYLL